MVVGDDDLRPLQVAEHVRSGRGDDVAHCAVGQLCFDQLDAAVGLGDLARPGNRLEALRGRRRGQWSIRINDQWRICFVWPEESPGPAGVEIVDYHR